MNEKRSSKKVIQKGTHRPKEVVDTLRVRNAVAEIYRLQSPLGHIHHGYKVKRTWTSMTTEKEESSDIIFPDVTADVAAVAEQADAFCRTLDSASAETSHRVTDESP